MAKRKRRHRRLAGRLTGASTADLRRELARRGKRLPGLRRRLEALRAKVAKLEGEIAELTGNGVAATVGGRKRPRNESTLVDALHKLLTGRKLTVTQAAAEVQRAGYKTNAAHFRTIVNQTLIRFRNRFRKVSRGVYTAT
jgi:hypothetical protein